MHNVTYILQNIKTMHVVYLPDIFGFSRENNTEVFTKQGETFHHSYIHSDLQIQHKQLFTYRWKPQHCVENLASVLW